MVPFWPFATTPLLLIVALFSWAAGRRTQRGTPRPHMLTELSLLIDGATNHAIYMLDTDGRVTIWNAGAQRIKGWTEAEVLGRHTSIFYPREDVEIGKPMRDLALAKERGRLEEESWRLRRDGTEFLASVTITALWDARGRHVGFGKVIHDVTDQRATERMIEARENQLRSILATVPDAMVVMDDRGVITSLSATAEQLFGYAEAEVLGRNIGLLLPADDETAPDGHIARDLSQGERHLIGTTRRVFGQRRDGSSFPLELAVGETVGGGQRMFTGFMRDLSAKEETEAHMASLRDELIHVSRLSAMGTMASTLAHELNQPIAAVANYVEGSIDLLDRDGEDHREIVREALKDAAGEAFRAGHIVRRLRSFVTRGEVEKRVEPLLPLIEEACALGLAGSGERGVTCRQVIAPDAGPVMVDRIQIQQVVVNLLRNAMEAMPSGGTLEIRATAEGGFAHLAIADNGPGLPLDVRDRLFEAFASTKRDGMGLGLSICRTIVEAHGGRIWAAPRVGGGTEFHFTLPRTEHEIDA
jgi:two-component system sensor kinase FixL